MSYILEALRKSDQHRRRGAAPGLRAPQASSTAPGSRVSATHALLAMALLGAGIAIGALRPWQTGEPAAASESAGPKPPESIPHKPSEAMPQPIPTQSLLARPSERDGLVENRTEEAAVSHAPAAIQRKDSVAKPAKKAQSRGSPPVAATTTKMAKSVRANRGANTGDDVGGEGKVLAIAELPLSVRQAIPQVTIAVHAYSDVPERRLIGIDDRVLREGELAAPDLVLEQITPDGVILRYKDYRFRRGVR